MALNGRGLGGAVLLHAALAFALVAFASPRAARAQIGSEQYGAVVVDAASGNLLSSDNPDELHHPASLTKLMTLYMLFEALRDHRVTLSQYVPVSYHAAAMEPTKLGVPAGGSLTVEEAILGIVTQSANDAAAAVGEMLGGDEDRFAEMMTLRAHALGMTHTTFRNASGLPDPDQWTTARDMAILSRHLIQDFPDQYHYFSVPDFVFHGRTILNHDTMLKVYPGADGLKTGWIRTSGHNLATSAMRGNVRLIGVVLGAATNWERDQDMAAQLDAGFQSEGVPVLVAHREPRPGLMASAHAATMTEVAQYRGARATAHRAAPSVRRTLAVSEATSAHARVVHGKSQPVHATRRPPMLSQSHPTVQPIGVIMQRGGKCAAGMAKTKTGCLPIHSVRTGRSPT